MKQIAGIVTFNPDIERLSANIESIKSQVDQIYLFDNASYNIHEIKQLICDNPSIFLISSNTNKGVSSALNVLVRKAYDAGAKWLLTLDQDSICPDNLMETYLKYTDYPKIALIAPKVQLQNGAIIQSSHSGLDYEYVSRCITSASFVNLEICKKVGGFEEKLFIDYVDHEYCKRLLLKDYKILCTSETTLTHELGSNRPYLWSIRLNKLFHTKVIYHEHSSRRVYYIIRNIVYYVRRYHSFMTFKELKSEIYAFMHTACKHILLEKSKWLYVSAVTRGLRDGFLMKL